MAPEIVAKRLVEHLERAGFVIMKRPPMTGGAALGQASERACWALVAWTCSAMAVKAAQTASWARATSGTPGHPVDLVVAMLTPGSALSLSRRFNLISSRAKAGFSFRYCSAVSIFPELRRMKKGQAGLPSGRVRRANMASESLLRQ